jgi:D-amino-acid dehydrogenase
VVGGGAVGLGLAYELIRGGAEVTVLERDRIGQGASRGNAGWVTPALCAVPVPGPGVMTQALKWMLRSDSPFLLRPRLDPAFAAWLVRFALASRPKPFARGLRALIAHNRGATEAFRAWQEQGVEFEAHREGMIFAALTEQAIHDEYALYRRLQGEGFPVDVELLDGDALRQREPALSDRVAGGMVSPSEWHVRPESLTAGLAAAIRRSGGEVIEGAIVSGLQAKSGRWLSETSVGAIESDRVVLTTGVWAPALLRQVGFRLPLQGAKGYSVTAAGEGLRPRHSIYLLEAKIGCSPFGGAVRLAGTLELAGLNLSLNRGRLDAVKRAASDYLRWQPTNPDLEWAGLRPFAPDGLPVIGAVPKQPGLFVSTGHGMSGITLAAVSARLLAPYVLGGPQPAELAPLAPSRF